MSSKVVTYEKFRDADDVPGNLAWAAKMAQKALTLASVKPDALCESLELSENDERLVCHLLRIPRKYIDIEHAGFAPVERVRSIVRALVACEALEIKDAALGKPILPVEITRIVRKLEGKERKKTPRKKLKARVYRPEAGIEKPSVPVREESQSQKRSPAPKPTVAPSRVSVEDLRLKQELKKQTELIKSADYYTFLGIGKGASDKEVHSAFVDRARRWHPDRVSSTTLKNDVRAMELASKLFQHLQKIESTLKDKDQRADYDRALGGGAQGENERRPVEAKVALQKAQVFERTKDLKKAEQHYEMAIVFDDTLFEAQVKLAWLIFVDDKRPKAKRTERARELLEPLIEKKVADAAYRLALIARTEDKTNEIKERIEQALKFDPTHKEAAQEKRILDRRRSKEKTKEVPAAKKKGLFGFSKN